MAQPTVSVADLAAALKSVDVNEKQLSDLRMLCRTKHGFPYTVDRKNAPQAETIESCRKVGSAMKRILGITSALPYGMNLVGFCNQKTKTWCMSDDFRSAVDIAGLLGIHCAGEQAVNPPEGTGFERWLVDNGSTKKTASNYAGAVAGRLKELAKWLQESSFTLSTIDSASNFEKFCKAHDSSNEIVGLNIRGKDMYRRALVWYAQYLALQAPPVSLQDVEDKLKRGVSKSIKDTPAERAARLAGAETTPREITVTTTVFERNPDVVAQVLQDAAGDCQGCGKKAPFNRKSDNSPYLEVHHRIPLSKGGKDSVANAIALCPNCHRKMHYGI